MWWFLGWLFIMLELEYAGTYLRKIYSELETANKRRK